MNKKIIFLLMLLVIVSSCTYLIELGEIESPEESEEDIVDEEVVEDPSEEAEEPEFEVPSEDSEDSEEEVVLPFQDKIVNEKRRALIAYENFDDELVIYDTYDEKEVTRFKTEYGMNHYLFPRFSPSGKKIAAWTDTLQDAKLMIMNIETGTVDYINVDENGNAYGWYGEDKIVAVCREGSVPTQRICVIDLATGNSENLNIINTNTKYAIMLSQPMDISNKGKFAFWALNLPDVYTDGLYVGTMDSEYEYVMDDRGESLLHGNHGFGNLNWVGDSLYIVHHDREGTYADLTDNTVLISVLDGKETRLDVNEELTYLDINHYSESEQKFVGFVRHEGQSYLVYFGFDGSYELIPTDFEYANLVIGDMYVE